jgi:putative transposase
MQAALTLAPMVGVVAACAALMLARATFYRWRQPAARKEPRPSPPRALSSADRAEVLATLNSDRFADKAPRQVFAALLDEGRHLCSTRTMYRVLAAAGEVRERRDQLRHPTYVKPELLATAPNQVWSWDITKLKGPVKWTHFHLYVILDVFSRYVVGWMVARRRRRRAPPSPAGPRRAPRPEPRGPQAGIPGDSGGVRPGRDAVRAKRLAGGTYRMVSHS